MCGGHTRLSEEVEHVSALLPERHGDCQDSLDEAAAIDTVSSEAAFSVNHRGPDGPLGRVVGRLKAVHPDERPEGRRDLEDLLAHALGLGLTAVSSLPQQILDRLSDRAHVDLEAGTGKSSVSHPSPELKHRLGLDQKGLTDASRLGAAFGIRTDGAAAGDCGFQ